MGAPPKFVLFGEAHLVTLGVVAAVSLGAALFVRRDRDSRLARSVCFGLALFALLSLLVAMRFDAAGGRPWTSWVPLQLCDAATLLSAAALIDRRQRAAELLWFWAMAGTLLAMVTPDLARGWPSWSFGLYFAKHGAVVASAVTAAVGLKLSPERGAPWRAFGWTLAWAVPTGLVDWATGANIYYLRGKPAGPTLLDAFGPWPVYLVVTAAFALALFWLLYLPFVRRAR